MTQDLTESELPRKGRSNAILTYETVEEIKLGIQRVDLKMDRLDEKIEEIGKEHDDHELRIRVLELAYAGTSQSSNTTRWLYQAIWPALMFGLSVFTLFLNSK